MHFTPVLNLHREFVAGGGVPPPPRSYAPGGHKFLACFARESMPESAPIPENLAELLKIIDIH